MLFTLARDWEEQPRLAPSPAPPWPRGRGKRPEGSRQMPLPLPFPIRPFPLCHCPGASSLFCGGFLRADGALSLEWATGPRCPRVTLRAGLADVCKGRPRPPGSPSTDKGRSQLPRQAEQGSSLESVLARAVPLTFRATLATHGVVSYGYSQCPNWDAVGFPLEAATAEGKLPGRLTFKGAGLPHSGKCHAGPGAGRGQDGWRAGLCRWARLTFIRPDAALGEVCPPRLSPWVWPCGCKFPESGPVCARGPTARFWGHTPPERPQGWAGGRQSGFPEETPSRSRLPGHQLGHREGGAQAQRGQSPRPPRSPPGRAWRGRSSGLLFGKQKDSG